MYVPVRVREGKSLYETWRKIPVRGKSMPPVIAVPILNPLPLFWWPIVPKPLPLQKCPICLTARYPTKQRPFFVKTHCSEIHTLPSTNSSTWLIIMHKDELFQSGFRTQDCTASTEWPSPPLSRQPPQHTHPTWPHCSIRHHPLLHPPHPPGILFLYQRISWFKSHFLDRQLFICINIYTSDLILG